MENKNEEVAVCRGCGKHLKGKPYYMGGEAYDPKTNERCKVNHYGGFVCSESCDRNASLELERTMPGHTASQSSLSTFALEHHKKNWSNK
jgi:ribosomal protein L34E